MDKKKVYEPPAAKLNRIMGKHRVVPMYELICSKTKTSGRVQYMTRVTCPISHGGRPLSAESSYSQTIKEAKHNAALRFIDTFLNYGNNDRYSSTINNSTQNNDSKSPLTAEIICSEGRDVLKNICLKSNFERPTVGDVSVSGPIESPTFTAECKVSDLTIKGQGRSKVEARLHATARMIQIMMETTSIHDILKFPQFATKGIQPFVIKRERDETITVSSNDNNNNNNNNDNPREIIRPARPNIQNFIINGFFNRKRKSADEKSSEEPEEKSVRTFTKSGIDKGKSLSRLSNVRKKLDSKIQESNDNEDHNSASSNENLIRYSAQDSQNETSSVLVNNNNNYLLKLANGENVGGSIITTLNTTEVHKSLTRLQAVSQIDRTLGNMERELYDKILNALVYSNLSYGQTVAIFSRNYEIFIHQNSPPKIFDGNDECTDQSIRVACLTKLLIDLKKYIEINYRKVI